MHYLQNADGSYTLDEEITGAGTIGETLEGELNSYDQVKYVIPSDKTITLEQNPDSNIIEYYYDRTIFSVKLTAGYGISSVSQKSLTDVKHMSGTYRWGETVQINAEVKAADETYAYIWEGWTGSFESSEKETAFTMPTENVSLTANATAALQNYDITVNHFVMDTEGNYPDDPQKTETMIKAAGEELLFENLKNTSFETENIISYAYGTFNNKIVEKAFVAADSVINLYYGRESYNVVLTGDKGINTDELFGVGIYYAGAAVTVKAEVLEGYIWQGWTGSFESSEKEKTFTMPGENVSLAANTRPSVYVIHFDANGGTGEMEDINADYNEELQLPECLFTRETESGKSSFMGWSLSDDAKTIDFSNQNIVKNLTTDDGTVIVLYAIWDDCPEITAVDRYFTLKEAQEGKITVSELLSTATAEDTEDGDVTDQLMIPNTNDEEWKQFTSSGYGTITYVVEDSAGNVADKTVKVYITDTTGNIIYHNNVKSGKFGYTRFISEKYYKNSPENGGLEEKSVWKTPEYSAALEAAMENRRSLIYATGTFGAFGIDYEYTVPGSISRDHVVQVWKFTREDVQKVKEYVNMHGLGKYQEADGLTRFLQKFHYCRQQ